jgi:hypothetical protein
MMLNIEEMQNKLAAVAQALNQIEVKGYENIVTLGGTMEIMRDVLFAINAEVSGANGVNDVSQAIET